MAQGGHVLGPLMAYATDLISDFYADGVSPLAVRMLVNHHTALLWHTQPGFVVYDISKRSPSSSIIRHGSLVPGLRQNKSSNRFHSTPHIFWTCVTRLNPPSPANGRPRTTVCFVPARPTLYSSTPSPAGAPFFS